MPAEEGNKQPSFYFAVDSGDFRLGSAGALGAEMREHSTKLEARYLILARHQCPVVTTKELLRFIEQVVGAPCAVEFVMCLYSLIMFLKQF